MCAQLSIIDVIFAGYGAFLPNGYSRNIVVVLDLAGQKFEARIRIHA
jgi:hypothetical protein